MNSKAQIAFLPELLLGLIILVVLGVTFFFFKSFFILLVAFALGGFILWKVYPNAQSESQQKTFLSIGLIIIIGGLVVGVAQPFSFVEPIDVLAPQNSWQSDVSFNNTWQGGMVCSLPNYGNFVYPGSDPEHGCFDLSTQLIGYRAGTSSPGCAFSRASTSFTTKYSEKLSTYQENIAEGILNGKTYSFSWTSNGETFLPNTGLWGGCTQYGAELNLWTSRIAYPGTDELDIGGKGAHQACVNGFLGTPNVQDSQNAALDVLINSTGIYANGQKVYAIKIVEENNVKKLMVTDSSNNSRIVTELYFSHKTLANPPQTCSESQDILINAASHVGAVVQNAPTNTQPPAPNNSPIFLGIFDVQGVINWFKSVLSDFFGIQLSIAGNNTAFVGRPFTATINLTSQEVTDSKYDDGYVKDVVAAVAVIDSSGGYVFQSPPTKLTSNNYSYSLSWTPQGTGTFYVVGLIAKQDANFNYSTNEWGAWSTASVITSEKMQITVSSVSAPPTSNIITDVFGGVAQAFGGFFNWLQAFLFGG